MLVCNRKTADTYIEAYHKYQTHMNDPLLRLNAQL